MQLSQLQIINRRYVACSLRCLRCCTERCSAKQDILAYQLVSATRIKHVRRVGHLRKVADKLRRRLRLPCVCQSPG